MKRHLPAILVTLFITAAVAYYILRTGDEAGKIRPDRLSMAESESSQETATGAIVTGERPTDTGRPSGRFPVPADSLSREERLALLAAILGKLSQRTGGRSDSGTVGAAVQAGAVETLSREYIQQQIREIIPLIKECYELALAQDPDISGMLKVEFTIVADEQYGGLVEESRIVEGEGMPTSEELATCVRETMYALRFKPPEGGGRVVVSYPFVFRAAERISRRPNHTEQPEVLRQ